jgi:hypothetical protein
VAKFLVGGLTISNHMQRATEVNGDSLRLMQQQQWASIQPICTLSSEGGGEIVVDGAHRLAVATLVATGAWSPTGGVVPTYMTSAYSGDSSDNPHTSHTSHPSHTHPTSPTSPTSPPLGGTGIPGYARIVADYMNGKHPEYKEAYSIIRMAHFFTRDVKGAFPTPLPLPVNTPNDNNDNDNNDNNDNDNNGNNNDNNDNDNNNDNNNDNDDHCPNCAPPAWLTDTVTIFQFSGADIDARDLLIAIANEDEKRRLPNAMDMLTMGRANNETFTIPHHDIFDESSPNGRLYSAVGKIYERLNRSRLGVTGPPLISNVSGCYTNIMTLVFLVSFYDEAILYKSTVTGLTFETADFVCITTAGNIDDRARTLNTVQIGCFLGEFLDHCTKLGHGGRIEAVKKKADESLLVIGDIIGKMTVETTMQSSNAGLSKLVSAIAFLASGGGGFDPSVGFDVSLLLPVVGDTPPTAPTVTTAPTANVPAHPAHPTHPTPNIPNIPNIPNTPNTPTANARVIAVTLGFTLLPHTTQAPFILGGAGNPKTLRSLKSSLSTGRIHTCVEFIAAVRQLTKPNHNSKYIALAMKKFKNKMRGVKPILNRARKAQEKKRRREETDDNDVGEFYVCHNDSRDTGRSVDDRVSDRAGETVGDN